MGQTSRHFAAAAGGRVLAARRRPGLLRGWAHDGRDGRALVRGRRAADEPVPPLAPCRQRSLPRGDGPDLRRRCDALGRHLDGRGVTGRPVDGHARACACRGRVRPGLRARRDARQVRVAPGAVAEASRAVRRSGRLGVVLSRRRGRGQLVARVARRPGPAHEPRHLRGGRQHGRSGGGRLAGRPQFALVDRDGDALRRGGLGVVGATGRRVAAAAPPVRLLWSGPRRGRSLRGPRGLRAGWVAAGVGHGRWRMHHASARAAQVPGAGLLPRSPDRADLGHSLPARACRCIRLRCTRCSGRR
jgi:hypothetical protein